MKVKIRPAAQPAAPDLRETRRQVLDCAAHLFREQGYAAVSLRDIAALCGMKAGSLYYHFASKEEIVLAILDIGVDTVYGEVRRAVEALGPVAPAAKIEAAVRAHLRAIFEVGDYCGASIRIFGHVPARVRHAAIAKRDLYETYWVELLSEGAAKGDLRGDVDLTLLRLFLFGAMNGTLEWYRPGGRRDLEGIARQLGRVVLQGAGIAAAGGTRPGTKWARRGSFRTGTKSRA